MGIRMGLGMGIRMGWGWDEGDRMRTAMGAAFGAGLGVQNAFSYTAHQKYLKIELPEK